MKNKFKERIKELRKEKKVTMAKLAAEALGYGSTAIANYESGRNEPSIDDLIKLATYFGVTIDYLVGASDRREG